MKESLNGHQFDRFGKIAIRYTETVTNPDRRIFISGDMAIEASGQSLPPGDETQVELHVPVGTLLEDKIIDPADEGDFIKLIIANQNISVKSALAQAGISVRFDIPTGRLTTETPLVIENGNYKVPIVVRNENHLRILSFPKSSRFPLLRLVVPSAFLTGDELIRAVSEMKLANFQYLMAEGPDLLSDQAVSYGDREALVGVSLPIRRYARLVGEKDIDLERLVSGRLNRNKLDAILGLVWDEESEDSVRYSPELMIGETSVVEMGPFCGQILVGAETSIGPSRLSIHSVSSVIDHGFAGNIRVEEIVVGIPGERRITPSSIKIHISK